MGKLLTAMRNAPKRTSAVFAMIAAATILPAVLLAWGPNRPTYTIENPADHVTFNSITNNPNIGDERNFVGIRESGTQNLWTDNQQVQPGKTYTVRVFVHNNAATSLNASGKGIAKDVVANVNLPTTTGKSIQVDGMVSSSNAQPTKVWDQAVFSSSKDFNLALVPGTLKYENNKGVFNLPESLLTATGAKLGYDKMDGSMPGCFQYSGYVSFQVKPQFAPTNAFEATKQVRKAGQTTWSESVNAKPGETVEYQLKYKNTGEIRHNNVLMHDYLPKGLDYVPGSSYLMNGTNPNGIKISDNVTTPNGINVGDYNPAAAAYVKFSAKVDGKDLTCGTHKLTNKVRVTADGGYKEDTADVVVDNGKCAEPKDIKVCELATKKIITIKETDFDASKHSKNLADCKEAKCPIPGKEHLPVNSPDCKENCPIPGKEHLPKDSTDCKETPVTPVTPVTPTTPTELPETGPAEAALSIVGLGSMIASIGYYAASRRALLGR